MIKHFENISGSEYHLAAMNAHLEIVGAGHGDGSSVPFNWDDRVTVSVSKDGTLQGLMVWRYMRWLRTVWICTSWVAPYKRHQGVNRALYSAVRKEAKKLGALKLGGGIHPTNGIMINAAIKQGRKIQCVVYEETL